MTKGLPTAVAISLLVGACGADASHPGSPPPAPSSPQAAATTTSPIYYFEGSVNTKEQRLALAYRAPAGGIQPDSVPYGPGPNQVELHTLSVGWGLPGGCGDATTLCGSVVLLNHFPQPISNAVAVIDSISVTSVTAVGAPYNYGGCNGNSQTIALPWAFSDPSSTDFQFKGHVDGTFPPPDLGASCAVTVPGGASCTDSTDAAFTAISSETISTGQTQFTITNTSAVATGNMLVTYTGKGFFGDTCLNVPLAPGQSCTVNANLNCVGSSGVTPGTVTYTDPLNGTPLTLTTSGNCICIPSGTGLCGSNGDCCSNSCNLGTGNCN